MLFHKGKKNQTEQEIEEQKKDKPRKKFRWDLILFAIGGMLLMTYAAITLMNYAQDKKSEKTINQVRELKELVLESDTDDIEEEEDTSEENSKEEQPDVDAIKVSYNRLFDMNEDMIGWLTIPDTNIDYPVMQTMENEEYYLRRNFYGEQDKNGCLLLDTDSDISDTSGNLMIHGHNMNSGAMFGKLTLYNDQEYGLAHNKIYFYTRDQQERVYELLAVFYSQIYGVNDNVFKYYQYFGADTQEEFNNFYYNIMRLNLYDTGVTAEYGDELITLSTCAYHTGNGRFVVVAKRVK